MHDRDHITLQFVSPMNEPDDSFPDCGQEGMRVPVSQRAAVVVALGRELAAHAPWAKVIADETTADAILADEAPKWLAVPGAARTSRRSRTTPTTSPPTRCASSCRRSPSAFGVPTWMTEICCYKGSGGVASSFGAHFDPTMTQGFWLADQIYADLTVAGDSAWYWWTALSPVLGCDPKADPGCPTRVNTKGFNDGLLYYDQHGPARGVTKIFTTKRFFVLGQFSRYVRPGAVRHDVSGCRPGLHAMAFATGKEWTVVDVERVEGRRHFRPRPSRRRDRRDRRRDHQPRRTAWPRPAPARAPTSGAWLVHLPASTIATYTFHSQAQTGADRQSCDEGRIPKNRFSTPLDRPISPNAQMPGVRVPVVRRTAEACKHCGAPLGALVGAGLASGRRTGGRGRPPHRRPHRSPRRPQHRRRHRSPRRPHRRPLRAPRARSPGAVPRIGAGRPDRT